MSEKSKEVVAYKDSTYDVLITVCAARVIDGIRRVRIISELSSTEEEQGTRFLYSACICSASKVENLDLEKVQLSSDLTIEDFLGLPEVLVLAWEEAAYEVNPHWLPQPAPRTEEEEAVAKKGLAEHQRELDKRLITWHKRQDSPPVMEEADEDWRVRDLEGAWKVWCLTRGLDWRHLPYEGGLLEQPEALMDDLVTISWRASIIKEMLKPTPTTPAGQRR